MKMRAHLTDIAQRHRSFLEPRDPGKPYYSMEEFILTRGQVFHSKALTVAERKIVTPAMVKGERFLRLHGRDRFQLKECYLNAQTVRNADSSGRLSYVEGFVTMPILGPVLHGWIAINGKVVDPTVVTGSPPVAGQVLGEFTPPREYFGIVFSAGLMEHYESLRDGIGWSVIETLVEFDPSAL